MKNVILVLISSLLLILDNSFTPFIGIKGAYPSLLFIFSISYSIIKGKREGVKIGVISGILQDIFFFNGFGVNALINMLICYVAGIVGEGIWKEKKLIPMITMFIASIVKVLGVYLVMYFFSIKVDIFRGVLVGIYNFVLMFIAYGFIYKYYGNDAKQISWRVKFK